MLALFNFGVLLSWGLYVAACVLQMCSTKVTSSFSIA